jgi:hypothetical protein
MSEVHKIVLIKLFLFDQSDNSCNIFVYSILYNINNNYMIKLPKKKTYKKAIPRNNLIDIVCSVQVYR